MNKIIKQKIKPTVFYKKKWFIPLLSAIIIISGLLTYRFRTSIFKTNLKTKINYITFEQAEQLIDKKNGLNDDKSFIITFGSDACEVCVLHYKKIISYEQKIEQGAEKGYVRSYVINAPDERAKAQTFHKKYFQNKQARSWKEKKYIEIKGIATPVSLFISSGKIKDIILGAAYNKEELINYVKSNF